MRRPPSRPHLLAALALAAVAALPAGAASAATGRAAAVAGEVAYDLRGDGSGAPRTIRTDDVAGTLRRLRGRDDVRYAVRNVVAHATQLAPYIPNDRGRVGRTGGWRASQWYLDGPFSINAPLGWANMAAAGASGAAGVKVAILDSGIAYKPAPPRPAATAELPRWRFLKGYDFIDGDDSPTDEFGHGTIVASILGGATGNGVGMAGIAYRTRLIPVRVLDGEGNGDATTIARGVRYAVARGAQVINLSLEFPGEYTARDIPQVLDALRFARRRGVTIVVAAGNAGLTTVPYPGRSTSVIAVGASTEHGCVADYSNQGTALDLVAPGGGADGEFPDAGCDPTGTAGRGIMQLTLIGVRHTRLGLAPRDGTSMASPQVAAAAAAVIATRVIGRRPSPAQIQRHLQKTARDLGPKGFDTRYGHGLLDLAAATATAAKPQPVTPAPAPAPEQPSEPQPAP